MRIITLPYWMRRPCYKVLFKDGPLDGVNIEWEGLTPPEAHWARLWHMALEDFVGKGTEGPGYMTPRDTEEADAEWAVYKLESRHPHTMHHDQPQWRYVFAGIAKASAGA